MTESVLDGSGLVQDSANLVGQFGRGDWAEGLLSGASAVLEVGELLKDPIAKLVSMGLGWVIEFFEPLQWVLDKLVGDQQQIDALSQSWEGIAADLHQTGLDLDSYYKTDTANWSGPGVAQYMKYCGEHVELYQAASGAATVTAGLIQKCGIILNVVRTIVRQLFTDCVGKAISIVLRYPPPATPAAAPEVARTIADTGSSITQRVKQLLRAFGNAGEMLKQSKTLFSEVKTALSDARRFVDTFAAHGSVARQVAYQEGVRRGLRDLVGQSVGNAARHAVNEGVAALPEKVVTESAKEYGKQVAEGPSTNLYSGPGPYRVSGTLDEPS